MAPRKKVHPHEPDEEPQEIHINPQRAWFSGATVWVLISLSIVSTCAVVKMSFQVDRMFTREQMRQYGYELKSKNPSIDIPDVDEIAKRIP